MQFATVEASEKIITGDFVELCRSMATNSVYHSVRPGRFRSVRELALREVGPESPQANVVVVVGAGASNAACGLPTGNDAARQLRTEMYQRMGGEKLVDDEIERLALQFNLIEGDFETILLALSKFDRPFLLHRLRAIFGRRHHPWLGYELLAHCLNHRFIDAIINFNFDEILDQAIADELGEGAFYNVVLDGDCPNNPADWMNLTMRKFRLPLYLKPHGSASQPSSLRFTRDSYTALPDGLSTILATLFTPDRPVHVLILGTAMQSIEFNHALRRANKSRAAENLMHFYFLEPESPRYLRFLEGMTGPAPTCIFSEHTIDISIALDLIWKLASSKFKDAEAPRGIERHRLVSRLFEARRIANWRASGSPEEQEPRAKRLVTYFRDRTFVELALAVAKTKGFAGIEDMAKGRVGTYFQHYRDQISQWGAGHDGSLRSLSDACTRLGLRMHGYGDAAAVLGDQQVAPADRRTTIVMGRTEFEDAAEKLAEATLSLIDSSIGSHDRDDVRHFVEVLLAMYDGEEVEVSIVRSSARRLSFETAELMPTLAALKWRTEQVMTDPNMEWDAVACTAKSGQWLLRSPYIDAVTRMRGGRVALVVSDTLHEQQLADCYGNYLVRPLRWLPWWLHNRNVTVFLAANRPRFAISFERRMRSSRIAPVFLTSEADVRHAWDSFVAYWLRAERFQQGTRDSHITSADLRNAEQGVLQEMSQRLDAGPRVPRPDTKSRGMGALVKSAFQRWKS